MSLKCIYFILILLFIFEGISAQSFNKTGSHFIRNYTPKEYSSNPQNWAITQDKRGIMYFGNFGGLLEFDSKNWKNIVLPNSSLVRSLVIDNNGIIYAGGNNEIGYIATDSSGRMQYISLLSKLKKEDKNFDNVEKIHATTYGVYFITSQKIYRLYNDTISTIYVNNIADFSYVINDNLFINDIDKGLSILQGEKLYPLFIDSNLFPCMIFPYKENKLLLYTKNKFYVYDFDKVDTKHLKTLKLADSQNVTFLEKFSTEIDEYFFHNKINAGIQISASQYAFCTRYGGIVIIDNKGNLVEIINKNRGLQNNTVYNVFVDKDKNLWAALENGISMIEISSPITKFNEQNGLGPLVFSITQHKNKIYAGTFKKMYYLDEYKIDINDDKHNFKQVFDTKEFTWDFCTVKNKKDSILLASCNNGVYRIEDSIAYKLYEISTKIYCFGLFDVYPDKIFLGLENGLGLLEIKYDENNSKVSYTYKGKFEGINNQIRKIACDSNGGIWITTAYNGIYRLDVTNKNLSDYTIAHYDTSNGLPELSENWVNYIDNKLIIASKGGFYKINRLEENSQLVKFVKDSSYGKIFTCDTIGIWQIYVDNDNKIWINSSIGLGYLSKDETDKYIWNKINTNKIDVELFRFYIDNNKDIWIITQEDLFLYNQKVEKNYKSKFNTLLRKVYINNDSVIFYGTNYYDSLSYSGNFPVFSTEQPKMMIPVLSYENNSVSFEFVATFYENDSKNKFRYILEGYNEAWSEWTDENKKEYTNLPEGTYKFRVKAKNIFEAESDEAVFEFTILPPWYRTAWAYIGYIIVFAIIFYIVIRLNLGRLKSANIRLEEIIRERTSEIKEKNEELQQQNEEINCQAKELNKINTNLENINILLQKKDAQITNSINYAKLIQEAILPSSNKIRDVFPESFVLFKPRDIVSGDFYWFA
ncbi:MAG: two-component regulator propeller domain-containing protein, partial [Bacteroidota bacterium]